MSRVPPSIAFWMLCAAVQASGTALQILNKETSDEDGALDVWCNDKLVARHYIRANLCVAFVFNTFGYVNFWPAGPGTWGNNPPWHAFKFELDADQVRKLIRRKRLRPKKRRGPRAKWREKLIPQVMRSREAKRLETNEDLFALVVRKAGERGFTLPKDKRPILKEIQKHRARN